MSLGGYENNPLYTQQYAGYTKMLPIGTLYNEGDGLRMAQQAGAKLWHMGAWESNGCSLAQPEDRVRNTGREQRFGQTVGICHVEKGGPVLLHIFTCISVAVSCLMIKASGWV